MDEPELVGNFFAKTLRINGEIMLPEEGVYADMLVKGRSSRGYVYRNAIIRSRHWSINVEETVVLCFVLIHPCSEER